MRSGSWGTGPIRKPSARVSLGVAHGQVSLCVEDDGVGIDPALARGGLVNLGERAHDLGGTFEVGPAESGSGTMLVWRVPLAG